MKLFSTIALVATLVFGTLGMAQAETTSAWMTVDQARQYAAANLGPKSLYYPVAISCRLSDNWIQVRFTFRSRASGVPFKRWQFAVSHDPLSELHKVSKEYKIISSKTAGTKKCVIAYR